MSHFGLFRVSILQFSLVVVLRVMGAVTVASILPFIRSRSDFDDQMTRILGDAFDSACKALDDSGQPLIVQEVIARRIIDAAKKGVRDPVRLRDIGLAALPRSSR
jgi:hypothetical protein